MVQSLLGNAPWDVFHQGVALHLGWSIGQVAIGVGVLVLAAWVPLRQMPGLGTVLNTVLVGVAIDWTTGVVPPVHGPTPQAGSPRRR